MFRKSAQVEPRQGLFGFIGHVLFQITTGKVEQGFRKPWFLAQYPLQQIASLSLRLLVLRSV